MSNYRRDDTIRAVDLFCGAGTSPEALLGPASSSTATSNSPQSISERAFPFGDLHVTVRRFDDAIIMHFPAGRRRGVVVSREPEATRDLNTFTTECLNRIER